MSQDKPTLYYVHDPMCAWCWGYKPTWKSIKQAVADEVEIVYVPGGLAPDSDVPMPMELRQQIASYWKKIENYLGTEFNYDFWTVNTPRRSTYPACRATLAARIQGAELEMVEQIQYAYYLEALNPSDDDVLIGLAERLGLDVEQFSRDYHSDAINHQLHDEIAFARSMGGNSFPSLFLKHGQQVVELPINYENGKQTVGQIKELLALA